MAFEIFKLFGSVSVDTSAANSELDKTGTKAEALGKKFSGVSDKAKKLSKGLTTAGKTMTKNVTAPIVALGTASMVTFKAVDEGMDTMIQATGATGNVAKELKETFRNVSGSVVGDFGDVGGAIGEVNTRFGLMGGELEDTSQDFLKFAKVTGIDATDGVRLVSRAMNDAGIDSSEYKTILDQLSSASQASGISIETLTENLAKYGAPMRELGFDTQEAIAIFSTWEKAGVNTEIAFSGMKKAISNWTADGKDARVEFKNLVSGIQDGSVTSQEAIEAFGQRAGPDLIDAIKGGRFEYEDFLTVIENSEGTLDGTYDELIDGGDKLTMSMANVKESFALLGEAVMSTLAPIMDKVAEKIQIVGDWFGKLDEDQQGFIVKAGMVAAAIGPVLLIFGKVAGAVSTISGLLSGMAPVLTGAGAGTGALGAVFTTLTGPVGLVIAAVVAFIAIIKGAWDESEIFRFRVIEAFLDIKAKVQESFDRIKEAFAPLIEKFQSLKEEALPILKEIGDFLGEKVVPIVAKFISSFVEGFTSVIVAMAPFIEAIGNLLSFIGNFVGAIVALISGDWAGAWEYAKAMGQNVVDFLGNIWQGFKDLLSTILNLIIDNIKQVWEGIKTKTTEIWDGIKKFLADTIQAIHDKTVGKITEMVKTAINWFIELRRKSIEITTNMRDAIVKWFTNLKDKAIELINKMVDTVITWFTNLKDKAVAKVKGLKDGVVGWIEDMKTKTVEKVKSLKDDVIEWFEDMREKTIKKAQAMVDFVKEMPGKMKTAIDNGKESVKGAFLAMWKGVVSVIKAPVNAVIGGANWILDKFGADQIALWEPLGYAKGTDAHMGGPALVNDQKGGVYREAIQMPSGETFIPKGRDVLIPNMPKGTKVLPALETQKAMKNAGIPRYEDGVGVWDTVKDTASGIWKFMKDPLGLVTKVISERVNYDGMSHVALDMGKGLVGKAKNAMVEWVKGLFEKFKDQFMFSGSGGAPAIGAITSGYGWRTHPIWGDQRFHDGVDIGASYGTPVWATAGGRVKSAGWWGGYGKRVDIDHGGGLVSFYAHLSEILARVGQMVEQGQQIGRVGSTGDSTGPHLHFGLHHNGQSVDPKNIWGYARGTNCANSGYHWVGEDGPELVNFRGGEQVIDHDTSKKLAGGITQHITINSPKELSPAETARLNRRAMQDLALGL